MGGSTMVGINMRHKVLVNFLFAISLLLASRAALAQDTLFEAYYRVMKSGTHVGYYIMKHEFDAKKKQFIATTFLKIEGADDVTESIKAVASEGGGKQSPFAPVSFTYTAIGGGQTRTVDGKVAGNKLTGTITANGKIEKISSNLKPKTISSLFLIYAILRRPEGLKAKSNFAYDAVAEELGKETNGNVDIKDYEDVGGGTKALRLENEFLGARSINYVNEKGEILLTLAPTQKITVEIVGSPEAALGSFKAPTGLFKSLFGGIPEGKKNSLSAAGIKGAPFAVPTAAKGSM